MATNPFESAPLEERLLKFQTQLVAALPGENEADFKTRIKANEELMLALFHDMANVIEKHKVSHEMAWLASSCLADAIATYLLYGGENPLDF